MPIRVGIPKVEYEQMFAYAGKYGIECQKSCCCNRDTILQEIDRMFVGDLPEITLNNVTIFSDTGRNSCGLVMANLMIMNKTVSKKYNNVRINPLVILADDEMVEIYKSHSGLRYNKDTTIPTVVNSCIFHSFVVFKDKKVLFLENVQTYITRVYHHGCNVTLSIDGIYNDDLILNMRVNNIGLSTCN